MTGGPRRWVGYALAWTLAAAVAVAVGLFAVSSVGASVRDRGPLGEDVRRYAEQAEGSSTPDPDAERVRRDVPGEFGVFTVECRGVTAYGVATSTRDGWRTVSVEPGPDDDVDAVFQKGSASIEIEVYCNAGRPTVSDLERKTRSEDG